MQDARAVANRILEVAERHGVRLTNLKLQKLLYFAQGRSIVERNLPIISGEFEAWQYGPVHPIAYAAFKHFGAEDITRPAEAFDPVRRTSRPIPIVPDPTVDRYVDAVVSSLGRLTAGQLVELTHVKGGPWARTIEEADYSANLGLKIRNETIRRHFARLTLVSSSGVNREIHGEVRENTPYSGD